MTINSILLQAGGSGYESIIMIVALFAIFYFFMIRPQSKKQKQIKTFREGLKNGDRVVTAGGIFGRIKEIKEGVVLLEVSDNVRIRVDLNSIYPSAEEASTADTQAK